MNATKSLLSFGELRGMRTIAMGMWSCTRLYVVSTVTTLGPHVATEYVHLHEIVLASSSSILMFGVRFGLGR